jgi:hypothetical protein
MIAREFMLIGVWIIAQNHGNQVKPICRDKAHQANVNKTTAERNSANRR